MVRLCGVCFGIIVFLFTPLQLHHALGDEYGRITGTDNSDLPALGSVLELVTSHCDPTINLFDKFYLTRGKEVVGTWPIDLRGCCQ